jgi:hypothetical protein
MEDLFDAHDCAGILDRVGRVRADAKPVWGKMNVGQMLAHSQVSIELALGDKVLKRALIGFLFGRIAKKSLLKPAPFGHNLPTAPEFVVRGARDVESERARLLALLRRFQQGGPAALTKAEHPFFGRLTSEEWSRLQWKHLDHHLRQFGA